jgi:hypothetical protein
MLRVSVLSDESEVPVMPTPSEQNEARNVPLLNAADEAIRRVLSKNSLEYLERHRQVEGE